MSAKLPREKIISMPVASDRTFTISYRPAKNVPTEQHWFRAALRGFMPQALLVVCLALFLLASGLPASAQTPLQEPAGEIAGRVTLGDKPLVGMRVMLGTGSGWAWKTAQRTVTDQDGNYRFTKIAGGAYTIIPHALAYVLPLQGKWGDKGKAATLKDDEKLEHFDFKLMRGGVITGRVSDANNKPIMGKRVRLEAVSNPGTPRATSEIASGLSLGTDDQGVYRIYGLPPGRYLVSFGADKNDRNIESNASANSGYFARTFYPDVKDKNEARIVELSAGQEVSGVNIKLGERSKFFAISGRVIDAATNKPLPRVAVSYGTLTDDKRFISTGENKRADGQGQFTIEGVKPGRYAAFVVFESGGETEKRTGEPVEVEITDSDVADLELKVVRGASVSGAVALEGVTDPALQARFAKFKFAVSSSSKNQLSAFTYRQATAIGDGSFHVTGLSAGQVEFYLGEWPRPRGFRLARVEKDGIPVAGAGLEIKAGEEVTGVRVVYNYNTGLVRGRVDVTNGQLTQGMKLSVRARRVDSPDAEEFYAEPPDARNSFVIDGLDTGEYEITLWLIDKPDVYDVKGFPVRARQRVKVTNGAETEVTLTLDLNQTEGEKP